MERRQSFAQRRLIRQRAAYAADEALRLRSAK